MLANRSTIPHLEIAAEKKVIGQHHASLEADRTDVSGDGGVRKAEVVWAAEKASEENCAVNGRTTQLRQR